MDALRKKQKDEKILKSEVVKNDEEEATIEDVDTRLLELRKEIFNELRELEDVVADLKYRIKRLEQKRD